MIPPFRADKTWAGFAVKSQGMALLAGKTGYGGSMWRLDNPESYHLTFNCRVRNFGVAVGGGVSVVLVFFFNGGNPARFDGLSFGNGGNVHLSIPAARLAKLGRMLKGIYTLAKGSVEFNELLDGAKDMHKLVTSKDAMVFAKEVVDGSVMVGYSYGIQGKIDILRYESPGGVMEDL